MRSRVVRFSSDIVEWIVGEWCGDGGGGTWSAGRGGCSAGFLWLSDAPLDGSVGVRRGDGLGETAGGLAGLDWRARFARLAA